MQFNEKGLEKELAIKDLVKHYDDVTAVYGLNLEYRNGEYFVYKGPMTRKDDNPLRNPISIFHRMNNGN